MGAEAFNFRADVGVLFTADFAAAILDDVAAVDTGAGASAGVFAAAGMTTTPDATDLNVSVPSAATGVGITPDAIAPAMGSVNFDVGGLGSRCAIPEDLGGDEIIFSLRVLCGDNGL